MNTISFKIAHSAMVRSFVHVAIVPFVLGALVYQIEQSYSAIASVGYIILISFLQWYRAYLEPSIENKYRRDDFFHTLSMELMLVFGILVIIFILTIF